MRPFVTGFFHTALCFPSVRWCLSAVHCIYWEYYPILFIPPRKWTFPPLAAMHNAAVNFCVQVFVRAEGFLSPG